MRRLFLYGLKDLYGIGLASIYWRIIVFSIIKQSAKRFIVNFRNKNIQIDWIKKDDHAWLPQQFEEDFITPKKSIYSERIEKLAQQTNKLGPQPLWEEYAGNNIGGSTRMPNSVRTNTSMGNLYTYLVQKKQPGIVVEFGTAFGVSGMYFLAGMETNNKGQLLTFEPNDIWRNLAIQNLAQISQRFSSVAGTFEDNVENTLPQGQHIDIAFIDAIHTKEFVIPQLEIITEKSSDQAIIILDDINFSDSMEECWEEVSMDSRFSCSARLGERVGILELNIRK